MKIWKSINTCSNPSYLSVHYKWRCKACSGHDRRGRAVHLSAGHDDTRRAANPDPPIVKSGDERLLHSVQVLPVHCEDPAAGYERPFGLQVNYCWIRHVVIRLGESSPGVVNDNNQILDVHGSGGGGRDTSDPGGRHLAEVHLARQVVQVDEDVAANVQVDSLDSNEGPTRDWAKSWGDILKGDVAVAELNHALNDAVVSPQSYWKLSRSTDSCCLALDLHRDLVVGDQAGQVANHNSALQLGHPHRQVAPLDGDKGATVHGARQRPDQVNSWLRTDVTLADGTVLGVLAPRTTPHAAKISGTSHAKAAVRVAFVTAHQTALVERDVGSVHHVVAVPYH